MQLLNDSNNVVGRGGNAACLIMNNLKIMEGFMKKTKKGAVISARGDEAVNKDSSSEREVLGVYLVAFSIKIYHFGYDFF